MAEVCPETQPLHAAELGQGFEPRRGRESHSSTAKRDVHRTSLHGSGTCPLAAVDEKRGDAGQRLTHHYLLRHDVQDLPRHVDHLLDVLALRELLHALLGKRQSSSVVLGRVRS